MNYWADSGSPAQTPSRCLPHANDWMYGPRFM